MGGGGKGSSKQPSAPDYTALAQQQGLINQQAANQLTTANRPNQVDAFGNSISWSQGNAAGQKAIDDYWASQDKAHGQYNWAGVNDPEYQKLLAANNSNWTQNQNLNDKTKAAWDTYNTNANAASASYGNILNNYLNNYKAPTANPAFAGGPQSAAFTNAAGNVPKFTSTAGNVPKFSSSAQNVLSYDDPKFNGDTVSKALYDSVMTRGRVEQKRESDSLDNQLRLQGLQPGTEAYNRSAQNLMTSQNDANLLASQNATLAGYNEARNQYGSYLQGNQAQFGNDSTAYGNNLQGQAQQFGQDLSGYGANLQGQAQNFNQGLAGYQANLASNNQNYNQSLSTYGANAQNNQVNQQLPLQQLSGMAGLASGTPYTPTYTGFSSATGYNPTDLVGAAQAQQAASQSSTNSSNSKKGQTLGAGAQLGGAYLGSK